LSEKKKTRNIIGCYRVCGIQRLSTASLNKTFEKTICTFEMTMSTRLR